MQNKALSLLGLARRAGQLSMGHDTALEAVRKKKAKLVIFSSDISARLKEEFRREAEKHCPRLPMKTVAPTMDEIHGLLGYRAGVMTVNDRHFADRIAELLDQEENAYGDKN